MELEYRRICRARGSMYAGDQVNIIANLTQKKSSPWIWNPRRWSCVEAKWGVGWWGRDVVAGKKKVQ
jgi:hypothetical protein